MGQAEQISPAERERLMRQQGRQQQAQEGRQLASGLAQQAATEGQYAAAGYWDTIGSPDIARERFEDDEHLEEFVKTEFSNRFALGNIPYGDYQSMLWLVENEFATIENEFVDEGCKLDDGDLAEMGYGTRPRLNDERARRLRSAMQAKKMHLSLSVGGKALDAGTTIHTVARSESPVDEPEEQGRLAKAKRWLTG